MSGSMSARTGIAVLGVIGVGLALFAPGACSDRYLLEGSSAIPAPTVGLPPLEAIYGPADVSAQSSPASAEAVRVSVPTTSVPSSSTTTPTTAPVSVYVSQTCPAYAALVASYPGWDVERMLRYIERESRCDPLAFNRRTHDRGLGQVHWEESYWTTPMRSGFGSLAQECGLAYVDELFVPEINVRCMYALWRAFKYQPWG